MRSKMKYSAAEADNARMQAALDALTSEAFLHGKLCRDHTGRLVPSVLGNDPNNAHGMRAHQPTVPAHILKLRQRREQEQQELGGAMEPQQYEAYTKQQPASPSSPSSSPSPGKRYISHFSDKGLGRNKKHNDSPRFDLNPTRTLWPCSSSSNQLR